MIDVAAMLLTWHNLTHYQRLMEKLRPAIAESRLDQWVVAYHALRRSADNSAALP